MERASFLLEASGTRIDCLLNPASVVVRRRAGIQSRQSSSGRVSGGVLRDDPIIYAGGGTTEMLLDLLFDTSLTGSKADAQDVRDLTLPLARLAEGAQTDNKEEQVPLVRFVWGKAWNVLGVVTAIAERLEYFSADGAPQRSWLRMRFLRVNESSAGGDGGAAESVRDTFLPKQADVPVEALRFFEVTGGGAEGGKGAGGTVERPDEIAYRLYGNPGWWRRIVNFNNLDDPWNIPAGTLLSIPPGSASGGEA